MMSVPSNPFPDDVRHFVEATSWRFAKTYAATWPHEYVVRDAENAPMILALAHHIFERGIEGRFFSQIRKYHQEGGKVYWSMDPTPEATTLVNRCDETRPMKRDSQPVLFPTRYRQPLRSRSLDCIRANQDVR
jgi:hypothetical protein